MRKETENWWKQAERDFLSAKKNLKIEEFHISVFLCQQSVEKGLKALYIHKHNKYFDPTHSLIFLGKAVKIPDQFFSFLRILNPEFVTTRYPDAAFGVPYEMYDEEIALDFLKKTEEVLEWIRSHLMK
ncbi:MAG: HEPN domain-containing protein [Candidatus Hodarchaeales archaeon]|jgi:HEPN domain-containing protein